MKMKDRIMYIELKTGYNDNGPAWIGKVQFSKSGQTIYFNGHAFKKLKSGSISSNHYDLETKEEYWISGVKINGQDRHSAGSGSIMIDKNIVEEYLDIVEFDILDPHNFERIEVVPTDKQKFFQLENN